MKAKKYDGRDAYNQVARWDGTQYTIDVTGWSSKDGKDWKQADGQEPPQAEFTQARISLSGGPRNGEIFAHETSDE